jgi:hypothetical protein
LPSPRLAGFPIAHDADRETLLLQLTLALDRLKREQMRPKFCGSFLWCEMRAPDGCCPALAVYH